MLPEIPLFRPRPSEKPRSKGTERSKGTATEARPAATRRPRERVEERASKEKALPRTDLAGSATVAPNLATEVDQDH